MASAEFSFKKYQVENGLSHNTTWCAIQDSYGFLWIGTSNGLNCYYGSGNKIYRNVLNGSSSNLVVISFLFQLSSSFLILLKVVDMFAF